MASFLARIFPRGSERREPVPPTDSAGDIEAQYSPNQVEQQNSDAASSDSSGASSSITTNSGRAQDENRIDGNLVMFDRPGHSGAPRPEQAQPEATNDSANSGGEGEATRTTVNTAAHNAFLEDLISRRLADIQRTSRFILVLTILQIMSTLATEHIHFLSLFSLFVPWTGFEGSKERNFAYLRAYYWGCWVMIPANFFHYLSFEKLMEEILDTPNRGGHLDENLKKELLFNHQLFNIVTWCIIFLMLFSLVRGRQIAVAVRLLRNYGDFDGAHGARREPRAPTGPLSQDELAAIVAFKVSPVDIDQEAAEKDVCVICQDEFQLNELAKRLNCRHMFHAQCIDAWLARSSSCPICNGDVRNIV